MLLVLCCTLCSTALAQAASQVTDVKWGVDKQNMLRFVVDLTEPATYEVKVENRMLLLTVDAGLQPQAAGTKKIKSSITDVMTVVAQGQQTLVKVPLWRDLPTNEYKSFVLKKDPQTKRPPRIVLDLLGTIQKPEAKPAVEAPVAQPPKKPTVSNRPTVTERPAPTGKPVVSNKPTVVPREPQTGDEQASVTSGSQPTVAPVVQEQTPDKQVQQPATPPVKVTKPAVSKPAVEPKAEVKEDRAKDKDKAKEKEKSKKDKQKEEKKSENKYAVDGGLKGKVITLDPGHGGSDPGAIGKNGTMEKDVTLEIALRVKEGLEEKGAKVYLTRTKDVDVYGPNASAVDELQARVDVAEKKKSDLFISIHINASTNAKLGGFSSYYYPKTANDARIADAIQKQLTSNFGVDDLGIREANFYVIKRCSMPATLLELCFLSNPKEEAFLKGKWFPNKASKLIVDGIVDYFK